MKHVFSIFVSICTFMACAIAMSSCAPVRAPQGASVELSSGVAELPAFAAVYEEAKAQADAALATDICVPMPKDAAGGFTHEQHKQNYYTMYDAGIVYQVTGDKRYVQLVEDMLTAYADMYPTLDLHPYGHSPVPGKVFWQTLNESVWLVHTSQAYAAVREAIAPEKREYIEKNLFLPMADFLENGTPDNDANHRMFNRMHNHATWGCAAVGMIGYAMGNETLVQKALYGSKMDGSAGFLKQMYELFSPDGYFTEGAYYLRYAIWPFMVFAQTIETYEPERQIFAERDSILMKAMNVLIQEAYNGEIIRMNDALLKTYATQEIVAAVDIAYWASGDASLLSIAMQQGGFVLSPAGVATARALAAGKEQPFLYKSLLLRDGAQGEQGGVALLREGDSEKGMLLSMKATSHGLSHGHYDKLTMALYDNGEEILMDYGAARFLNVESKSGGRYTHENDTYSQQTVAHNALVVDETSHFHADYDTSSEYASQIMWWNDPAHFELSSSSNAAIEVTAVQALDEHAYEPEGVKMVRTMMLVKSELTEYPLIIDIMQAHSERAHAYDLPWHYNGHIIDANFSIRRNAASLCPAGKQYGYEHLWQESKTPVNGNIWFTWLQGNRFYSVTTTVEPGAYAIQARSGANDPEQNLRMEPCMIIRQTGKSSHTFASVIEPHGLYDLVVEKTIGANPQVKEIRVLDDSFGQPSVDVDLANGSTISIRIK